MLKEVNRGGGDSFFNLENHWRSLLESDPTVKIEIEIRPQYSGDGKVPEAIDVRYSIDGGEPVRKTYLNE